jgi:PAS domain S-box-containing protein
MIVDIFLIISFSLQCVASYLAIRIARRSRWRTIWLFLAVAIVVMTLRHAVMMADIFSEAELDPLDVISEWLALIISALLVVGLAKVGTSFAVERREEPAPREIDRHYNALFEQSAVGIAQIDSRTGRFVRINQCYCDMVGYTREEMLRKDFQSITHLDDLQADLDNMARLRTGELSTFQMEKRYIRKNGEVIWVRLTVLPLWIAPAEPDFHLAVIEEITDRKRAEERLRTSELHLNEAQRVAHIGNWNWDIQTNTITWSDEMYRIFGLEPKRGPIAYETFLSRIHPEDRDEVNGVTQTALKTHQPFDHNRRVVWPDGTVRVYHSRGAVEVDTVGTPVRMYGTAQDITDCKRAEETAREANRFNQQIISNAREGIIVYDRNGRYAVWNPYMEELTGLKADRVLGKRPTDLPALYEAEHARLAMEPGTMKRIEASVARAMAGDIVPSLEVPIVFRQSGEMGWTSVRYGPFRNAQGEIVGVIASVWEMTERKRAEEALQASEERFRASFKNARIGMALVDHRSGRFVETNRAFSLITGYSEQELKALTFSDITHPDDRTGNLNLYRELIAGKREEMTVEKRYVKKDGSPVWVNLSVGVIRDGHGHVRHTIGLIVDISQRKQTEAALREHADRMQLLSRQLVEAQEAEGRRIGRELHDDLGQILTSLKIYLQTLPERTDPASFGKLQADSLALIDQALDRVRNLSSDLRPTVLDDLGLAAALRWMLDRRAREAGFRTQCIARDMDERMPPEIESTAFRIAQEALTNVVRHANAGSVRVELSRRKGVVKLLIVDDGIGFDPEAARAEALRGKSLGLVGMEERASLVNGRISLRSAPGKGTELKLEIPLPVVVPRSSGREPSRSS